MSFVSVDSLVGGAILGATTVGILPAGTNLKVTVPAAGAAVHVYERGTTTPADCFADEHGSGAASSQPLTTDADGRVVDSGGHTVFTAQPAELDVVVTGAGISGTRTIPAGSLSDGGGGGGGSGTLAGDTDVAISSPADQDGLLYEAATSEWSNARVIFEAPSASRMVRAHGGSADDTAMIEAAIAGVVADGQADGSNVGRVLLDTRGGPFQLKGALDQSQHSNSQLALPFIDASVHTNSKFTLELSGPSKVTGLPHWNQAVGQKQGAVLYTSGIAGTNDGEKGPASVLGGATNAQGFGGQSGNAWSNMLLIIDGVMVVAPAVNPTMCGFNLEGLLEAQVGPKGAAYMVDAAPAAMAALDGSSWTNQWVYGLQMPMTDNNDLCVVDDWSAEGVWYSLVMAEHTHVRDMRSVYCGWGLMLDNRVSTPHWAQVDFASIEICLNMMGLLGSGGNFKVNVGLIDGESGGSIWDGNSLIYGDIRVGANASAAKFDWTRPGLGGVIGNWNASPTNGQFMRITCPDVLPGAPANQPAVPASATAFWNKATRDAAVTVSGDGLVGVIIDGHAMSLVPGTYIVPSGKSIELIYTGTVAWDWILL